MIWFHSQLLNSSQLFVYIGQSACAAFLADHELRYKFIQASGESIKLPEGEIVASGLLGGLVLGVTVRGDVRVPLAPGVAGGRDHGEGRQGGVDGGLGHVGETLQAMGDINHGFSRYLVALA